MKLSQKAILACVAVAAVSAATGARAGSTCGLAQHGEISTSDTRERVWMATGEDSVRAKLKDGPSARFRDVYFCRGSKNIPMTCGWVNGKNSFGGYHGFQRFISAGSANLTYLESEVQDFHNIWRMMCR